MVIDTDDYQNSGKSEMQSLKILIEKHTNGYIAYPLGLKGVVVRETDT